MIRAPVILVVFYALGAGAELLAQPCTYDVASNTGSARETPWESVISLPQFNPLPGFRRLNYVNWFASVSLSSRATVRNDSDFQSLVFMNGSTRTSVGPQPGLAFDFLDSRSYATGSSYVLPHSEASVSGARREVFTGTTSDIETPFYIGDGELTFNVAAEEGVISVYGAQFLSGDLRVSTGLRLTYNCTFIGLAQDDPILPTETTPDGFRFDGVPSGRWFDPVSANGFRFDMLSPGDAFTSILGFPAGFDQPFLVNVDGAGLGAFLPGEQLAFSGDGVRSFTISGLLPEVDPSDPRAFPIQLGFNRDGVTFTMTPIPEPGSLIALGIISALSVAKHRRRLRPRNR